MNRRDFLRGLGVLVTVPVLGETYSRLIPLEPRVMIPGWTPTGSELNYELAFEGATLYTAKLINAIDPSEIDITVAPGIATIVPGAVIQIDDERMRVVRVRSLPGGVMCYTVERGIEATVLQAHLVY